MFYQGAALGKGKPQMNENFMELVEAYLLDMEARGRSKTSIDSYRVILAGLQEFLEQQEGVELGADTAENWRRYLEENGYSRRTINKRISVLNGFVQFLGKREWQYTGPFTLPDRDIQPELVRTEYLRLLQAAKRLERERTYLLVKAIGGAGIRLQELPQLTVEAVRSGRAHLEHYGCHRMIRLPDMFCEELLNFTHRSGITEGPVFITRDGTPMTRTGVWNSINAICHEAQVAPEKANPRCLWKLYQSTYQTIHDNIVALTDQAYDRMLEQEELTIGWNA